VFAHPDDESIAVGARMKRFSGAHFVHATDGAPRNGEDSRAHGFASLDDYRVARTEELQAAFHQAGIAEAHHESFAIPDQEASLHLVQLTNRVGDLLKRLEPELIFTHPYEGGHPDHDACAFGVHSAVSLSRRPGPAPLILEAAFYHAGAHGLEAGCFLPGAITPEIAYTLSEDEQQRKRNLLACFTSQRETLKYFPLDCERFRIAPEYDFERPPHAGAVWYERFAWGMSSQQFCQLAGHARRQLRELAAA
jgi:LmbE family N-acetylglucosaminyl deacetylase